MKREYVWLEGKQLNIISFTRLFTFTGEKEALENFANAFVKTFYMKN